MVTYNIGGSTPLTKILVADDSATIQKVIKIAFARLTYEILEATSFPQAANLILDAHPPSMVILDANLPGLHGPEGIHKLLGQQKIPVLLLVGSYDTINEDVYRQAGFQHFLRKPFESQDIVSYAEKLLLGDRKNTAGPQSPRAPSSQPLAKPPADGGGGFPPQIGQNPSGLGPNIGASIPPPPRPQISHDPTPFQGTPNVSRNGLPSPDLGAMDPRIPAGPGSAMRQAAPSNSLEATLSLGASVDPRVGGEDPSSPLISQSMVGGISGASYPSSALRHDPGLGAPPPPPLGQKPHGTEAPASGAIPQVLSMTPRFEESREYPQDPPATATLLRPGPGQPAPAEADSTELAELLDLIRGELPGLVSLAVHEYCEKHFANLAREVIVNELRRLTEEKARHLVDN